MLFGAGFGIVGALLSGWPAVAFIGCAEMAIGMIRRARTAPEVAVETVADDVPVGAPIPMPLQSIEAVSAVTAGPVADDVPTPQVRAAGRTVARKRTRRHTPEQRAERAFADHLEAGSLPSLRAIMRDIKVGQDKARSIQAHLASLATANGRVNHG
ncbi:MAG TPA: hypothetical protein VIY52_01490 [Streptosporangiaceae bacterium]